MWWRWNSWSRRQGGLQLANCLFMIDQLCDGRMVPAERASGIAFDEDVSQYHTARVQIQHSIGQGTSGAQDQFQGSGYSILPTGEVKGRFRLMSAASNC